LIWFQFHSQSPCRYTARITENHQTSHPPRPPVPRASTTVSISSASPSLTASLSTIRYQLDCLIRSSDVVSISLSRSAAYRCLWSARHVAFSLSSSSSSSSSNLGCSMKSRTFISLKSGFHSNAIACVGKQPIMVATASTEHSYWLALAFVA